MFMGCVYECPSIVFMHEHGYTAVIRPEVSVLGLQPSSHGECDIACVYSGGLLATPSRAQGLNPPEINLQNNCDQ